MKTELKLALLAFGLAVTASLCWCYSQDNTKHLQVQSGTNALEDLTYITNRFWPYTDNTNDVVWITTPTNYVYVHLAETNSSPFVITDFTNVVWCYTNMPSWSAEELMFKAKANRTLTNLVNLLVSSGDFCRIRGHVWHFGNGGALGWYGVTFDSEFKDSRRCGVCGRIETRQMSEWKAQ